MSHHFCDVFVAYYIIAISNSYKKTPNIALYGILFEKSQRKLCGRIFSIHSNKLWPNNLHMLVIEVVEIWEKVVWPHGFCAWRIYIFHPPHNFFIMSNSHVTLVLNYHKFHQWIWFVWLHFGGCNGPNKWKGFMCNMYISGKSKEKVELVIIDHAFFSIMLLSMHHF